MRAARRPVVAMVSDAIHPYHRGGKEIRYYMLSHRLSEWADVRLYTMKWWPGPKTIHDGPVELRALCRHLPLYAGGRRSIPQAIWFALSCLQLLWHRFDVLEADHMPYLQIIPLRLVAWIRRKRLVVTWHEVWGAEYWQDYAGQAGRVGAVVERIAMHLPDEILAASPNTGERLREVLGADAPVTVAPNGVDLTEINATTAASDRYDLITVGRLLDHKRVDLLLRAIAALKSRGRVVNALVVGSGPHEQALRLQAAELDVTNAVTFKTDVTDQGELYGLLKGARVFVAPSEREGFGIAVLEAIACGLHVVTTSAPDNLAQHLVRESARGRVCDPDVDSLARAIDAELDLVGGSEGELPSSTRRVEPWVRQYDWATIAATVMHALLRLGAVPEPLERLDKGGMERAAAQAARTGI